MYLSVYMHIFETTSSNFTKFYLHDVWPSLDLPSFERIAIHYVLLDVDLWMT